MSTSPLTPDPDPIADAFSVGADVDSLPQAVPDDHPAYDRLPTSEGVEPPAHAMNRRVLAGVGIFVVALLVTYFIVRPSGSGSGSSPDLLGLVASDEDAVELALRTDDLDTAEEFILGEFGWPIRVPVLAGCRLVGVGVDAVASGVELPVLEYQTADRQSVTVYVYDYAFLDAAAGRLSLAPAVYSRLAEDDGVDVRRIGDKHIILWRRRAVIYTAVTLEDPTEIVESLRRR